MKDEEITDKESLEKALNKYVESHTSENYTPHWMFDTIDAIVTRHKSVV